MIKKILFLFLAFLMILSFAACIEVEQVEVIPPSLSTPEEACESLCSALKAYDLSAASACLLYPDDIKVLDLSGDPLLASYMPLFQEWTGKLEYTVRPASISGGNAQVTVDYVYVDASSALADAARIYLQKAKDMAAEGKEDSEIEAMLPGIIEECAKNADLGTASLSVTYELVQGGGEWKIVNVPQEFTNVFTADLFKDADSVASDLKPYLPAN